MIKIADPDITENEINSVVDVLKSGILAQSKKVEEFEKKLANYLNVEYAIATSSGTTALHTALLACGISNNEVITTPFTFIATANSILMCGGKPIFVDIDVSSYNLDANLLEEKITKNTKAIIPVHLYGQSCDIEKIVDIAKNNGIKVIEDAAQAMGAEFKRKKCGTFGDCGVFSFYATKNLAIGEGGAIVTNDKEIMEKCKKIRNHGQSEKYVSEILGYNYRTTEITAAIGIEKLKRIDEINEKRIRNAGYLTKHLKNTGDLILPKILNNRKHVFHQYTIRTKKRDDLQKFLLNKGIESLVFYPLPIHKQPVYKNMGYNEKLDIAEMISKEVLSIPVHQNLTKEDLLFIVNSVKEFFNQV